MSDRKKEIERKKQMLEKLREAKKGDKNNRDKGRNVILNSDPHAGGDIKDINRLLSELDIPPLTASPMTNSTNSSEHSRNQTPDSSLQVISLPTNIEQVKRKQPQLTIVPVQSTSIPPKEVVYYTRQTQTSATGPERDAHATDYYDEYNLNPGLEWEDEFTVLTYDAPEGEEDENSLPHQGVGQPKLPPGILPSGLPHVSEVLPAVTQVEQVARKEQPPKEIRELSEEEKQMIILSDEYRQFIDRSGRIMERALCEYVDIFTDYPDIGDDHIDEKVHQRISFNRTFFDERWSKNRTVTSLDWSPHFPELLLASYNNNEESPNDPDGVVLIWNTKFKKTTPEYIFHCQSAVLSTTFAKFQPNLILGGTYSGQVVLWDIRVNKRTPIQRTPLSASAHTHPVYCTTVVGTQNAHNLISISTDGRMCSWSLDMLGSPQDTLDLIRSQGKPVAATCLDFPSSDVNNFVVGSEEGAAYAACRHGAKRGISEPSYDGHQGPITGISTNGVQGGIDFSHMFLTSSFDWTIKLWSLKDQKPIYSFDDNGDYVLDVKWSPVHPALFAAVDCSGRLDMWNLNQDTEVPTASVTVEGSPALNKVSWTPSGLHVTVGDNMGRIHVYDVAENFAHPRIDEWNKFLYTTEELRNSQVDMEVEKLTQTNPNYSMSSINTSF